MTIFYFSGTGNSYWAAKEIGRHFSAEVTSITDGASETEVTVDDDVIGIVAPTYISDVPWMMKAFLLKVTAAAANQPYTFAVMTSNCGTSGKAFESIDRALQHRNMKLSLAFDLQMPGNCVMSTAEENQQRFHDAPERIAGICAAITERTVNYTSVDKKINPLNFAKPGLVNSVLTHFKVTDACNHCGQCIRICPTGSMEHVSGKVVHRSNCAACYACLHWCPKQAILVNVPSFKNIRQYHHPEISFGELFSNQSRCAE